MKGYIMARTTKTASVTPATCMVIKEKNAKGETVPFDAFLAPTVHPAELISAGSTMQNLCLNILADRVDPTIRTAIDTKGGLARMFNGELDDKDVSALKKVTKVTPEALRTAWAAYVARMSRVRKISLQAMAKALVEPSEPTATLKDAMVAYFADKTAEDIDAALYDIAVQFDLLPKAEA